MLKNSNCNSTQQITECFPGMVCLVWECEEACAGIWCPDLFGAWSTNPIDTGICRARQQIPHRQCFALEFSVPMRPSPSKNGHFESTTCTEWWPCITVCRYEKISFSESLISEQQLCLSLSNVYIYIYMNHIYKFQNP